MTGPLPGTGAAALSVPAWVPTVAGCYPGLTRLLRTKGLASEAARPAAARGTLCQWLGRPDSPVRDDVLATLDGVLADLRTTPGVATDSRTSGQTR